jgi:hypothetical protein
MMESPPTIIFHEVLAVCKWTLNGLGEVRREGVKELRD